MPKFDVKPWKEACPNPALGVTLTAAVKEWNAKCETDYDDPATDPKKLVDVANAMFKKLLAAINETDKRLGNIKPANVAAAKKIDDAEKLLVKWEGEAKKYVLDVTKWAQNAAKEVTEERKNLFRAQEHFAHALINGFEDAMKKLSAPAKEFEAAMKARNYTVAAAKFDLHRSLLHQAAYHLRPISVAKVREAASSKFHVQNNQLTIPQHFHTLAAKVKKADERDDDMADQLEKAAEADASGDAEPDSASTTPEYRKAVREIVTAFKGILVKMKGKAATSAQYLQAANRIKEVPVNDAAWQKTVLECRALNEQAFAVKKEFHTWLDQMRNPNSPWRKKAAAANVTEADNKKTLQPQVIAAVAYTRRLVGTDAQASRAIEDWLRAVVKAHPESADAKTELTNMSSKYHIRLI